MSDNLQINANTRTELGKAAMRRMRREGLVPGVVYGGEGDPVSFTVVENDLFKSLRQEAFSASVLTLDLGGKQESVVIKELQRHPYLMKLMHLDLMRVSQTSKLTMTVPFHFTGEDVAPGVKDAGGSVSHSMSEVTIACLPKDLPKFITVDISHLEEGHSLHLSDIKLPEGVEVPALALGSDYDTPVVSIHILRGVDLDEEESGEEAATEDEEGESEE